VGSFEGRILPTARRMAELGVADGASIETPARVETQIRQAANGNASQPELAARQTARRGGAVVSKKTESALPAFATVGRSPAGIRTRRQAGARDPGELGIEPGGSLRCILTTIESDLGLPVVVAALPNGIAGCCWRQSQRTVLWVNGTEPAVRQRFTLAHELGHVRCAHDLRISVDTFETLAGKTTDSREIQANAFAAELLAPADGVRP
jgi:IrrE N-terminal-like domain